MTKFEEMRLRAVKFQEMTGCELRISENELVLIQDRYVSTYRVPAETTPNWDGLFGFFNDLGSLDEAEWIRSIDHEAYESGFNARFPTLLEAQGWIAVEDGLPPIHKRVSVLDEGVQVGHGAYIDFRGNWASGVWGNPDEGDQPHPNVTHWKPLDQFPQP